MLRFWNHFRQFLESLAWFLVPWVFLLLPVACNQLLLLYLLIFLLFFAQVSSLKQVFFKGLLIGFLIDFLTSFLVCFFLVTGVRIFDYSFVKWEIILEALSYFPSLTTCYFFNWAILRFVSASFLFASKIRFF